MGLFDVFKDKDDEDDKGKAIESMSLVYWESFQIQEHSKSFDGDVPKTVLTACSLSFNDIWAL